MKVNIKGKEIELHYSMRIYMVYETLTGKSISFDGLDRNIKVIINNSKIDDLDVCNGEVYVYGDILGDVDVTNGDIRCRNIAGDIDQTNGDIYKNT